MNNGYYPYSVKPDTRNIRFDQGSQLEQLGKYKEEEQLQKADPTLPHEMTNITNYLGDTFASLTEIRNILTAASENSEINKHVVDNIKNKIDEINKIVLEIPEELDKIGI